MTTLLTLTLADIENLALRAHRMKGDFTLVVCGLTVGRYHSLTTALVFARKLQPQTDALVQVVYTGE